MKLVDLPVSYLGADIVDDIIRDNQKRFSSEKRRFEKIDLIHDELPKVDLILCRDCLFHFSHGHIWHALHNIKKSGSNLLLTTTNPSPTFNRKIVTGEYRKLNLQAPPFSLPPPILSVDEGHDDKHMALWRISDISIR
jgi:hypothetical protein